MLAASEHADAPAPTRDRKITARFVAGAATGSATPKKKVQTIEGGGVRIGDIEHVAEMLTKLKGTHDLLKAVHQVLCGRPGKQKDRRAGIRDFRGFDYAAAGSVGRAKVTDKLHAKHWTVVCLRDFCLLLGLERSGDRDALVGRLVDFLDSPATEEPSRKRQRKEEEVEEQADEDSGDDKTAVRMGGGGEE